MSQKVFEDDLVPFVRGGGKIVLLVSRDLIRLNGACVRLAKEEYSGRKLYRWDGEGEPLRMRGSKGWDVAVNDSEKPLDSVGDLRGALNEFMAFEEDSLLWLPLIQPFLVEDGAEGQRNELLLKQGVSLVKWALDGTSRTGSNSKHEGNWPGKTIILGGMEAKLPVELKAVTHTIRWDFPSREEIRELLTGEKGIYVNEKWVLEKSGKNVKGSILFETGLLNEWVDQHIDKNIIENMIRASQGLDLEDCKVVLLGAIRNALDRNGIISQEEVDYVREKKVRLIGSEGLLSVENTDLDDELVGLEGLTKWVDRKTQLFLDPGLAAKHGVRVPRGILLTGVPGCGKSLSAKTVAIRMNLPLLGFDLGTITNSMYGQTEENMHRALKQAEGMAPCVLWIDEFEKMFASANDAGGNMGHEVTQRVNGIFLKWMEERSDGVFVVATSNDLSGIKAEYRRSGRWDGTFFFDLPSKKERVAILISNLKKFQSVGGHTITIDDIEKMAEDTEGWASSDLAGLIKEAKDIAFDKRIDGNLVPVKMEHVESAMKFITPLCKLDSERLNSIRRAGAGGKMTAASLYDDDDVCVELKPESTSSDVLIDAFRDVVREQKEPYFDDDNRIFE